LAILSIKREHRELLCIPKKTRPNRNTPRQEKSTPRKRHNYPRVQKDEADGSRLSDFQERKKEGSREIKEERKPLICPASPNRTGYRFYGLRYMKRK